MYRLTRKLSFSRVIVRQFSALQFHLVGGLPGAADHFADASHRLRIRRHHADRAEIVKNVFGPDGFRANARIGKRHIFGNRRRQVMTHHQHVDVLVHGVARERHGRIRGRRQHVRQSADLDDVRSMTAAGAFGVIRVDRPTLECRDGIFDESRFVQSIGVNRNLHVEFFGHTQTLIDRGGVVPQSSWSFRPEGAGAHLFAQRFRKRRIAFAQEIRN